MCGCPTHGRVADATIPLVTISTMDGGRMVSRSTSVPHPWPVAASPAYLRPATRPRMGHPHAPRGQGAVQYDGRSLRETRNPRCHPPRVRRKNRGRGLQTIRPRRAATRSGPVIHFPPYYLNRHPPQRISDSELHSLVTVSTRHSHESLRSMSARVIRQPVGSPSAVCTSARGSARERADFILQKRGCGSPRSDARVPRPRPSFRAAPGGS